MKNLRFIFILIIMSIILFSCGKPNPAAPNPDPTAVATATDTMLPPTPTIVLTSTPTRTATEMTIDTATETPVDTATNTPVDTETQTPAETATETPVNTATDTPDDAATETPVNTAIETMTNTDTQTQTYTITETNTPFYTFTATATATTTNTPLTVPIINELDCEQAGALDTQQFVELFSGIPNLSLNGYILVFFNGATDTSYLTVDLNGWAMDANGFFTVGNTALAPDITIMDGAIIVGAGVTGAVALYQAAAVSFPDGTAVTTANLVDALVYSTRGAANDAGLLTLLNAGQPQLNESLNALRNTESMQRSPNGAGGYRNTSSYQVKAPTYNASN